MTGIRERRFFPAGASMGRTSAESGRRALAAADLDPRHIGALVHGSVCRDYLEPATACGVHHALGLPRRLPGVRHVERLPRHPHRHAASGGHDRAGANPRRPRRGHRVRPDARREPPSTGSTRDETIDRRAIKQFFASLTIGSGSVAVLLCDRELSRTQNRLEGAAVRAHTHEHGLCQSDGLETFMRTDSEQLMHAGVEAAVRTFETLSRPSSNGRATTSAGRSATRWASRTAG